MLIILVKKRVKETLAIKNSPPPLKQGGLYLREAKPIQALHLVAERDRKRHQESLNSATPQDP
jgi:hypothetical protein